jgi:hypothetical protein
MPSLSSALRSPKRVPNLHSFCTSEIILSALCATQHVALSFLLSCNDSDLLLSESDSALLTFCVVSSSQCMSRSE